MQLGIFTSKLNKVGDNVYTIEEGITMPVSGVYEAELAHDNINESSIAVYSGPDMTGRAVAYTLNTPAETPWKRIIHIESEETNVYISYETTGDQAEADDINKLAAEILRTQNAVNALASIVTGTAAGFTWGFLAGEADASSLNIEQQPTNQTCSAGGTATFTIVATGSGINYQWQYYDESDWTNFTSGNEAILIVNPTSAWNGRRIRCRLTDVNNNELYSNTVTLTVV